MSNRRESRNIKLIIAYDGTDYHGWQRQLPALQDAKSLGTIQGAVEAALEKLHKHPVILTGSGRTDSGVHAAGQAANFYTDIGSMAAPRFVPALNSILPPAIRVLSSEEAPPGFHARFDARSRTYRYFFICGREVFPAGRPCALRLRRVPRIALLNEYARLFRGEMDCSAFASSGDASKSRSRYLYNACFFMEQGRLVFEIRANAFLWKMVRSVAGTMLLYEERGAGPEDFRRLAASGRRADAGPTLPPQGLFLWQVEY
jgi:tRNA pseudouridine38-40 synthase